MKMSTLHRKYREEGALGIWIAVASRLPLVNGICIYRLFSLALEGIAFAVKPAGKTVIRALSSANPDLAAMNQVRPDPDLFRRRLELGHFCILATDGSDGLGFVWVQYKGPHKEERYGYEVAFSPQVCFYYDLYILPRYRGRGLLEQIMGALAEHARDSGASGLLASVELQNKRSLAAHKRLGMKPERVYCYARIGERAFHKPLGSVGTR